MTCREALLEETGIWGSWKTHLNNRVVEAVLIQVKTQKPNMEELECRNRSPC